ncbi:hypothetical protein ZIOFF_060515 [Zingiber officinale]|uniref:Trichome birefringence-like C-terminal domain-containing protein n=1 Tax=Zingiber officinale TaxID=94328 RepID=A0A8J5FGT2_ZINOF|nr:hypothetical protein ZIOFF_060515 [Zingiber officinale]
MPSPWRSSIHSLSSCQKDSTRPSSSTGLRSGGVQFGQRRGAQSQRRDRPSGIDPEAREKLARSRHHRLQCLPLVDERNQDHGPVSFPEGCSKLPTKKVADMKTEEAYRLALRWMRKWVGQNVDPRRSRTFLVTMSPTHSRSVKQEELLRRDKPNQEPTAPGRKYDEGED